MKLAGIDLGIIFGYLVITVLLGFWISKKASKNLDSYFLGGKSLPWYMLGLSNASGMFDITGTMWMVALAVAGMEPGFPDDLSCSLAAQIECTYRSRMAKNSLW